MYNSAIPPLKSGVTRSRLQKWGVCTNYWYKYINCYIYTNSLCTRPIFINEISSPLTSMVVLHYCIFPLTKVSNLKMF